MRKRHREASALTTSLPPSVPFLSGRKREKRRHEAHGCCAQPSFGKSLNVDRNFLGFKKIYIAVIVIFIFLICIVSVLNVLCGRRKACEPRQTWRALCGTVEGLFLVPGYKDIIGNRHVWSNVHLE